MESLVVLEKKLYQLLTLVQDFSQKNKDLAHENRSLKQTLEDLRFETARFAEENAQLAAQLKVIEDSLQRENIESNVLQQEKNLAKLVVDDLIKSIDALIERESQQ
jgi:cell shape-determining protein MreC